MSPVVNIDVEDVPEDVDDDEVETIFSEAANGFASNIEWIRVVFSLFARVGDGGFDADNEEDAATGDDNNCVTDVSFVDVPLVDVCNENDEGASPSKYCLYALFKE